MTQRQCRQTFSKNDLAVGGQIPREKSVADANKAHSDRNRSALKSDNIQIFMSTL